MGESPSNTRSPRTARGPETDGRCFACGATGQSIVHEVEGLPVDSCRLTDTRSEAEAFPRGVVRLTLCPACGFLSNAAFDPSLQDYSAGANEVQSCSPRFQSFARAVANRLIEKYDVRGKDVLEIGCGSGYFLRLLCGMGANRGVGIDPNVPNEPDVPGAESNGAVRFIKEYYDERHADLAADLVICRHTLEHVQPVGRFLQTLRRCLAVRPDTVVFVEVPDAMRILHEVSFWDAYYEHCSYFTGGSLARAFRAAGFEILHLERGFGDQYLLIEARASGDAASARPPRKHSTVPHEAREREDEEDTPAEISRAVAGFRSGLEGALARWKSVLEEASRERQRVVLWGSSSKASTFTITLGATAAIDRVVNINPAQQGRHVVGTGQRIVSPDSLVGYDPDLVICLNPIYEVEITTTLRNLGIETHVVSV